MNIVETSVMYINKNDLVEFAQHFNIDQIEWFHVKNTDFFLKQGLVIFVMNGKYKVLKSRW